MIRKKLSLLAIAAFFFTGCTMIPKYMRPEAPIPAGWPSGPAYKETPSRQGARLPPTCNGGNSSPMNDFK